MPFGIPGLPDIPLPHIDPPKIDLPKIDLPKIDPTKIINDAVQGASGVQKEVTKQISSGVTGVASDIQNSVTNIPIPPEFEEIHKTIENLIKNPLKLTQDAQREILEKISAAIANPASDEAITKEIDTLSTSVYEIKDLFDVVAVLLKKIKTTNARPDFIQDVEGLIVKWGGHHTRFKTMLASSWDVVVKAGDAVDDFAKHFLTFLSQENVSVQQKKADIKSYMEKLTRDKESSKSISQEFTDIAKVMETFQTEWRVVIDKYRIDALENRIAELDRTIASLENTLKDLNDKIRSLCVAVGVLDVSAGVSSLIGTICPLFWIGTLLSIIGTGIIGFLLGKVTGEFNDVQGQLNSNKQERKMELATLQAAKELSANLDVSKQTFTSIIIRLDSFAQVWAVIRADLQAIDEKLEYVGNTESQRLFTTRLSTAKDLYETLGKALHRYREKVKQNDFAASGH